MTRLKVVKMAEIFDRIYQTASSREIEIYAVGGYVRDLIMDRETEDLDFVVIGDAISFARAFKKEHRSGKVVTYGQFGTAMLTHDDIKIEFVSARSERYEEHSRKPIIESAGLESDLSRRDFTINCLALRIDPVHRGEVIDIFNGLEDLKNGIIRTPLDPELTFSDDPLRMLRAVRFAARFAFRIAPDTWAAIARNVERMEIVSRERITEEFRKIMLATKPSTGLHLLRDSGLNQIVFPELDKLGGIDQRKDHHHKDVFLHTLEVVDNISEKTGRFELRLAALLHDIAKPQTKRFVDGVGWTFHGHEELGARMTERIGRRMRLPVETIKYVKKLVRLHLRPIQLVNETVTDSAIRRLLFDAGAEIDDLMTLCRADITSKNPTKVKRYLKNFDKVEKRMQQVEEKDRLREFKPAITGIDIMNELGVPPGRIIGEIKQVIVDAILDGEIPNEREACMNYFREIREQFVN